MLPELLNIVVLNTWRMTLFDICTIIGGLLIIISKDKKEDELSEALRHQCIAVGFIFSTFMYVLNESKILTVFNVNYYPTTAGNFIIRTLIYSIGVFYMSVIIW